MRVIIEDQDVRGTSSWFQSTGYRCRAPWVSASGFTPDKRQKLCLGPTPIDDEVAPASEKELQFGEGASSAGMSSPRSRLMRA